MTMCSGQMTFDFYQDRELVADFKGGQITSDAGLLAIRELDEKLGWLDECSRVLTDPRDPDKTQHCTLTLFRQRVFALVAGYEDCNDHDRMRTDPALKIVTDRAPEGMDLASQPTLSRFENWVDATDVAQGNRLLVEHYIRLHREDPPDEIVLDVDPTDDPCYGQQQLALFNGFYDQYMHLPLLVFERSTGMLLGVRLRGGNVHPARRTLQVLGPIVRALREAFPQARIIVRADAGFAVPRLYRWCERNALGYLIGIGSNAVFERKTQWAVKCAQRGFDRSGEPRRHVGAFWHQAGTWGRRRRIIYKAEAGAEGTNRRYVVTNLYGAPARVLPRYEDRGTCETFIDQLKNGLKADRLSCSRFVANAFRLLEFALAYNLVRAFALTLEGTELEGASAETIRTRLLKIGARVRQTVRRVWVHMASGFPLARVLEVALGRIREMPACRAAPG